MWGKGFAVPDRPRWTALREVVHSRRGGLLDVADGAQRLDAERGVVGDALGLVGSGGRRGEDVVEGVGQRPDRRQQCLQEQGLLGSAGPYVATPM